MMYCDEVIAEVWRNRDAFTAQHHNSFNEMLADLQRLHGGELRQGLQGSIARVPPL